MKIRKMLFYGMLLVFTMLLVTLGKNANANVLVQGSEMSNVEYADLLSSIPEGHELVSNDEYDALVNQRALTGLYHNAYMQTYGWLGAYGINYSAGVPGEGKRLEALKINIANMGTSISYRLHVQGIGWQEWRTNGAGAGTTGQSKRTEAIQITTSGLYGVSYRAHVQTYGWLNWVSSGQSSMYGYYSGTTGQAKRMESIEFKLYRQTL